MPNLSPGLRPEKFWSRRGLSWRSEILSGQPKSLVLAGPFSWEIAQGRDSNAPREPSIDCGLYERGCDKGKSYRSVDLSDTAFLNSVRGFLAGVVRKNLGLTLVSAGPDKASRQ